MAYTNGDDPTAVTWIPPTELWVGFLLLESGYLIDTNGGRIILDGGISSGDDDTSVTWLPGD